MHQFRIIWLCIWLWLTGSAALAQVGQKDSLAWPTIGTCKAMVYTPLLLRLPSFSLPERRASGASFLKVAGSVRYDYWYRSQVDTPFRQHDFQQHSLQLILNMTVREQYPLVVNIAPRISNSPYFRNTFDVNLRFDKDAYLLMVKQRLLQQVDTLIRLRYPLTGIEGWIQKVREQVAAVRARLNGPGPFDQLIYLREQAWLDSLRREQPNVHLSDKIRLPGRMPYKFMTPKADSAREAISSLQVDSLFRVYIEKIYKQKDSIEKVLHGLLQQKDSLVQLAQSLHVALNRKIVGATDWRVLQQLADSLELNRPDRPRIGRLLSGIRSVGLGRSLVNYSELTAWNVALTGIAVEYNQGWYGAVAAGKIDYGFRQLLKRSDLMPGQHLLVGRIGWGDKDHRAIIVSGYTGRKVASGVVPSSLEARKMDILGYAVEGILKKDAMNWISGEVGKTTQLVRDPGTAPPDKGLWQLSDNSNMGLQLKGQLFIRKTSTLAEGFYRKTGEHFQSFSLFSSNTDQSAWLARVSQSFFRQQLAFSGSLRRNDFTNPFAEQVFRTSTVFKSIQATARFRHWPVLSIGYTPGTQLYVAGNEQLKEYAYYQGQASLLHQYTAVGLAMSTAVFYNAYFSKATDSVFQIYNGRYHQVVQSVMVGKFRLEGSYNYSDQELLQYSSGVFSVEWQTGKWLRVSGAARRNSVKGGDVYVGGSAGIDLTLGALGRFHFSYDKDFLPTLSGRLFGVDTGRAGWYKTF